MSVSGGNLGGLSFHFPGYLEVEDFPGHIARLVQKEKESEEQEKRQREIERNTCKVRPLSLCVVSIPDL